MTDRVLAQLAALKGATASALKVKWRALFDTEPPPYNRRFLENRPRRVSGQRVGDLAVPPAGQVQGRGGRGDRGAGRLLRPGRRRSTKQQDQEDGQSQERAGSQTELLKRESAGAGGRWRRRSPGRSGGAGNRLGKRLRASKTFLRGDLCKAAMGTPRPAHEALVYKARSRTGETNERPGLSNSSDK